MSFANYNRRSNYILSRSCLDNTAKGALSSSGVIIPSNIIPQTRGHECDWLATKRHKKRAREEDRSSYNDLGRCYELRSTLLISVCDHVARGSRARRLYFAADLL
jgi:hypothetical protein